MSQLITRPVRMSSTDIANLTGKRHCDVLRDIRKMLTALGDDAVLRNVEEDEAMRIPRGFSSGKGVGTARRCLSSTADQQPRSAPTHF